MPSRLADDEIIPDDVDRSIYIQGARILLNQSASVVTRGYQKFTFYTLVNVFHPD